MPPVDAAALKNLHVKVVGNSGFLVVRFQLTGTHRVSCHTSLPFAFTLHVSATLFFRSEIPICKNSGISSAVSRCAGPQG